MPVAETWERMEKASLPESSTTSSQPDFIPISRDVPFGTSEEHSRDNSVNGYQQQSVPSQAKRKRLITGEVTVTGTPWRTKEYTCDPPGLHEEICDFYEYMKPRPAEIQMRGEVILRTMSIILHRWPQAKVHVFGSFCTALFLPTGDIDLVVHGQWQTTPLFSLEEDLRMNNVALEDSILVLDKTVVPIIKFIDKLTEVRVDISFNQESGMKSARMIQQFIQEYPFLPKLVFVLKQFLYERNLHEVYYGGISSYSLILLLVSFLQLHPRQDATESNPNLGVLLIEFFELYGRNFNYMKTAISVLDRGKYIPKEDMVQTGKNALLYVMDPSNPTENAAGGCFGLWQVKQAFDYAFCRLHSSVLTRDNPIPKRESLLSDIIKVSKEVEEYRNWVDSSWPVAPLNPVPPPPYYYPSHILPPIIPQPSAGPSPYLSIQPQAYLPTNTEPSSSGKHLNHSSSSTISTPPLKPPSNSTPHSRSGKSS
jgi:non-canonical poly(A) RNA polymerase PAPD5/7